MRRFTHYLALMFLFVLCWKSYGQASAYNFSHQIGTFTPNSSAATDVPEVLVDSGISTALPIGFSFGYCGNLYTQFFMSSNGVITFGATGNTLTSNDLSTANAGSRPIIAPLWDDLDGRATVNGVVVSGASYELTGTAPNRVLTVEWLNWEWNWSSTDPVISFQVKLYETTNKIEFIYQHEAANIKTGTASIGIGDPLGSGSGSFLNLNTSMAVPTVTSTVSVINISSKPSNNQVFIFEPPTCMYFGNVSVNNITTNTATVTLTHAFSEAVQVYVGTTVPAANAVPSATIPSGTTAVNITGLNASTLGYKVYIKYACGTVNRGWFEKASFNTACDVITGNFFEGFETSETGGSTKNTFPYCWSYIDTVVDSGYGYVSTVSRNNGSNGYHAYRIGTNDPLNNGDVILVSPATADLGNGTKQIRFWAKKTTATGDPKFEIYSLNGTTAAATKTLIQSIVLSTTWTEYIVPLPPTTDDYFGFSFDRNNEIASTVYLDDINYEDLTPCIFPIKIKATNITTNGAVVSWDISQAAGVTGYEYEIRTSGNAGSGATGLVQTGTTLTTSVSLTNLHHSTKFYVYVRSICGTSKGMWNLYPIDFNTLCDVYTGAFYESFDSYTPGGSTNNNFPYCWGYVDNLVTTGYGYIDDTNALSANNSYRLYRTHTAANIDENLILISPETDNLGNGNGNKQVRFSVKSSSATAGDKIEVVSSNGKVNTSSFTVLETLQIDHSTYKEYTVVFPLTTDDYFGIRLAYNVNATSSTVYIDNVYYEDAPYCKIIDYKTVQFKDIKKNGFKVEWKDLFNLNVPYEVEVRTTGTPGTPGADFSVITNAGASSAVVSGIAPSKEYKVYIRALCSATLQGEWSVGLQISTLCDYADLVSYTTSLALCGPQKANLTAVLADSTAEAAWYDNENDGIPLFEGPNFISTTDITQARSFWLRSKRTTPNTPIQLGEGVLTTSNSGSFVNHSWGGYKHQYIFTAAELNAKGLTAGAITALKFDIVTTGTAIRKNFSIALGKTTQNAATTTHIDNSLLTQVYNNANLTLTVGLMDFTFTTPYVWDGVSNIVVQTNWSNENAGGTSGTMKYHTTLPNMTTYTYADRSSVSAILSTNTGSVTNLTGGTSGGTSTIEGRPNTVFVGVAGCISPAIEIPITVEPKPIFELSTDKITSCEGDVSDVVTIASNLGGYDTFVWTPSTGVSGDAVNGWSFSTAQEQEYTLSATQSTGICEHIKTVRVFAGVKPVANPNLATIFDVCKNVVTKLDLLSVLPADATIGAGKTTTAASSAMSAFVQGSVYSKQQYIYSAAELTAQGVTGAGYITNLSFETTDAGASLSNASYTVKMLASGNTSFAGTNFYTGNFATVYSKVNHTHSFQGVQTFVLDSPFYWDGQSNLIVEITQQGAGSGNNAQTYYSTVAGTNVGMYAGSATDANPLTGTATADRLNLKFGLKQATVTWSPASNLYLDAAATVPYTSGVNASTVYSVSSVAANQVYTAVLTGPNGCDVNKTYTVNTIDVGMLSVQDQVFCKVVPVTDVVVSGAVGATLSFYNTATGGTPITTISQNGTYYAEAAQGTCKSTRVPFNVSIVALALPNAQLTQFICGSGTVSNLTAAGASGAQIKWYDSATATVELTPTTALADNTTYYASQALSGCESGRIAVLVDINPAPAALSPQTISLCGAINYGSVNLNQAAGAELVWYQSATSQQPIPNTNQIVNGTYYVSQKINGCESPRVQVTASAQGSVPAPTATIQNICGSGTVAQLTAQILPDATAEWFSNATSIVPLAANTPLVNGTYYLAQKIGNCLSVKIPVAVRVISTSAPVVSPFTLCEGSTVADLDIPSSTGISYKWYLNGTSPTALPSTDVLKSGYYFVVREQNGCESSRTQVQVTINSRPNSPTGNSPQSFVDYAELSNIAMNQPNVKWYVTYDDAMKGINPLPQNMPLVDKTTYYAVVIGSNGCPSYPTAIDVIVTLGNNDFDLTRLKYYPNPVHDVLTINYSESITKVEVFDLNGRLVVSKSFDKSEVQLDFSALSTGTYMLKIQTKENSQFVKVVKK